MNHRNISYREVLRLIDANLNRSKEGLRVCEDVVRFVLGDARLTRALKKLRHECSLALNLLPVPYQKLVSARDVSKDVGKESVSPNENETHWLNLVIRNMKRSQESLRVLEEVCKMVFPRASKKFQNLRFELYELEKKALGKF